MSTMPPSAEEKKGRLRAVAIGGLLALVLAAVLAAFFWLRVCDEQVTGAGRVVTVCRHVATTDPPIVVLGVLAVVLLSVFYGEISGFGITLKRKVEELDERARANERKADDLEETVDDLADFNRARIDEARPEDQEEQDAPNVPHPRIRDLTERYNTIRWTMPGSRARTVRMSEVTHRMREALHDATDFDVDSHLRHEDRGVRLAAYAYLQEHPAPADVGTLVAATSGEDKPFGQAAALRALQHQLAEGARIGQDERRALSAMRDRVGADTDRGELITAVLA